MRSILIVMIIFSVCLSLSGTTSVAAKQKKPSGASKALNGRILFEANGCLDCHRVGKKGNKDGVILDGIGKKRDAKFLREHLTDPDEHVKKNSAAFKGDPNLMPFPNLSRTEINLIVEYLLTLKK